MNNSRQIIVLDQGWRYRSEGESDDAFSEWKPARPLPTTIHLDLLAAQRIPDPFDGKNEELVQWVGQRTWVYERALIIPGEWARDVNRRAVLVSEGLDTFATVRLNGKIIHESNNMFLSHRVDITEQIRAAPQGQHSLQITFHAVEPRGDEEVRQHPDHNWLAFASGVARLATRKAQYHYGWDWGPKLLDCGPWRPIYLESYRSRIVDTFVRTHLVPDCSQATVDISVEVEGDATHAGIALEIDGYAVGSMLVEVHNGRCKAQILVQDPKLWWPFTLGDQARYKAIVVLTARSPGSSIALDRVEKTFGIRRIELVQRPLENQEGSSFFFRINNVPIFAGGSCWIPTDSFLPRTTAKKYRELVSLARESNQVMIRVWGGGIYEDDAFYEACDEQGILVWQDLMLACGIFPAYPEFQKSVRIEIDQNIKRLRHHPSIALWCGNNEDYIIPLFSGDEYDPNEKSVDAIVQSRFPARVFYEHIFPEVCQSLSPDIPYWPGSPYGGEMVNSDVEGDVHQWHVWHLERFPYQEYPELSGRFISEFGMQAAPSLSTTLKFFPPNASGAKGPLTADEFMKFHNKCDEGAEKLEEYCTSNITFNQDSPAAYVYGTQLIQSEAVSAAYRAWRRNWKGPGREYCAGALVWQFNDCWPVTSWAITDSDLQRKMAFWAVKRENAAITAGLSRKVEDGSILLEAWACNMTLRNVIVNVEIKSWDVRTGKSVWSTVLHTKHHLEANRATELGTVDMRQHPPAGTAQAPETLAFAIYILPTGSTEAESPVITRHVNFHEPLKEVPLQANPDNLSINIAWEQPGNPQTTLNLESKVPMKGLFVEISQHPDVFLDDNGMDLVPGEVRRIPVSGLQPDIHQLTINWLSEKGWQSCTRSLPPHGGHKV